MPCRGKNSRTLLLVIFADKQNRYNEEVMRWIEEVLSPQASNQSPEITTIPHPDCRESEEERATESLGRFDVPDECGTSQLCADNQNVPADRRMQRPCVPIDAANGVLIEEDEPADSSKQSPRVPVDVANSELIEEDEFADSSKQTQSNPVEEVNDVVYSSGIQKGEADRSKQGLRNPEEDVKPSSEEEDAVYSSGIRCTGRQKEILKSVAYTNARAKEAEEWRPFTTGICYQQSRFANDICTSRELMERLRSISRKSNRNLERLYRFCRVSEGLWRDGVIEEVVIATTGWLARVFSKSTAAEVIKLAERIDLLICTDSYYAPSREVNGRKEKNGTARKYIINPKMAQLITRTYLPAKASRMSEKGREEDEVATMPEDEVNELLKRYNVRLSSHLHLPARLSDGEVRACIYARYPQLAVLKETMERINREYYAGEPMLELHQRVKITRGEKGVVSKIGTRCTSRLCQLRANDIPFGYEGQTREMFLERYFEGRKFYEYDVKSSIYRVARFLHRREWLPRDIDFYARMAPYEFTDKQARADYKAGLAMQLYFGGSPEKITNNLYRNLTKQKRERGQTQTILERQGYSREEVLEAIRAGQACMQSVVGPSIESEVFLHEGGIYLMVLEQLLKRGMNVVTVYDEFISDDERLEELCEELLPKMAEAYLKLMRGGDYKKVE